MEAEEFVYRSRIDASAEDVFAWHLCPGAFQRLVPPWDRVRVLDPGDGVAEGSRVVLRVKTGPVWQTWAADHDEIVEGRGFRDVQVEGPFAAWEHTHRFQPAGPDASWLEDDVRYELPMGALGRLGAGAVRRKLTRMFTWRHQTTADDVVQHRAWSMAPWRVLVTGASGSVGRLLTPFLTAGGHTVLPLVRGARTNEQAWWDLAKGEIDLEAALPLDAVVHLAGENVAGGRWSTARKARIRDSRVQGTRLLAEALARLPHPPRVLVTASATGLYGDREDEVLTETSAPGGGFLADVAQGWEAATAPAKDAGIRVVHLRFGVVLDPTAGALKKLLPLFRFGLGGRLGSGDQYMPWIDRGDVLGLVLWALATDDLAGAVNAVAPETVTNLTFTQTLARVLSRPAIAPAPAFALRLAMGEMADEMLLASQRVQATVAQARGYRYRQPTLEGSLRHVLGRP